MSLISLDKQNRILVLSMNNPPVNSLGFALRSALVECLQQAFSDPGVDAIVLTGSVKAFSAGADISEFAKPQASAEPNLLTVIDLIEHSPKPVIAAVQGACLGGGFELALGCHYRIASAQASFALPEIKLGLIPGAGGTQKLPRLIDFEYAFNFMLRGEPISAAQLFKVGGVDLIAQSELLQAGVSYAEQLIAQKAPLKRIRDLKVNYPNYQAYLEFAKNTVKTVEPYYPAPQALIRALLAACSDSFAEGMQCERRLFLELMQTSQSKAMRYAFFAQRACSKIEDVPSNTPVRQIAEIGVVGAGTMGGGIAMNFLQAGIPVRLLDTTQEALDKGISIIRKNYESSLKKGKLTSADLDKRMALLTPSIKMEDLATSDMVIEAVFEDMGVKEQVFKKLDQILKPGAILASNTSTLDVNKIASFTNRASDVIGTHFFSPANVMKLLEVVRGEHTSKEVLATVMQLSKVIKKTAVVSGVCDGFIGNRMIEHYIRSSVILVEQGASPEQVDKALEAWGMIMGPFRMSDLAGNDIGWAIRKRRYVEKPNVIYSKLADAICEAGRFGQKTGAGWYRYASGSRKPLADPQVDEIISSYRKVHGIVAQKFTMQQIIERTIYSLINEGARILEEGFAARASDIDVVYLTGYGFPLHRGGPMKYADEVGLFKVMQSMQEIFQQTQDPFWRPAQLIKTCVKEGTLLSLYSAHPASNG